MKLFKTKDTLVESVYLPFADETIVDDLINSTTSTLAELQNRLDIVEETANNFEVTDTLDPDSTQAISSKAVHEALDLKEDKYDFSQRIDELLQNLITHNNNGE